MRRLREFRTGKPGYYPDQSIYAEYACAEFGLAFSDLDSGNGLLFGVSAGDKTIYFGAGRCSWYPPASRPWAANIFFCMTGIAAIGLLAMNERTPRNI